MPMKIALINKKFIKMQIVQDGFFLQASSVTS